jgi:hypothetical protein
MCARGLGLAIVAASLLGGGIAAQPDGDAGASTNGCEGVVPGPLPAPFSVDLSLRASEAVSCGLAQPDEGEGTIPLRRTEPDGFQTHWTRWTFYSSARGAVLESARAHPGELPAMLLPQPLGFAGFQGGQLWTYSHDGSLVARNPIPVRPDAFAADPGGGVAIAGVMRLPGSMYSVTWQRFDKSGRPESTQQLAAGGPLTQKDAVRVVALGVAVSGHALVFWEDLDGCWARWVDRDGTLLTPPFHPPTCAVLAVLPLLDGGLILESRDARNDVVISARVTDGKDEWSPPPRFLLDNPHLDDEGLFLLPAGKGYALRDRSAREELRLFDREGSLCGRVVLPDLAPGTFSIGRDGTLVTQSYAGSGCVFHWWPQLFR